MLSALTALAVLAVSFMLTLALSRGVGPSMLDHPNDRSLHATPTPRSGGLAIVAAIGLGAGLLSRFMPLSVELLVMLACAAGVFAVSIADDVRHVAVGVRMLVHLAAAAALVTMGPSLASLALPGFVLPLPPALLTVFAVLFVVWMTNLYNFMDGMDGFAGGMGVVGFATFAALAGRAGDPQMLAVCAVVACACAGFLLLNFPPARIFMGDAGSSVLGFLAAALALEAQRRSLFPLWLSVLVFSPFIVDATVTLVRRGIAGERVWQAHRSHFYQRLVQLGWGHRRTTAWEYVLMAGCAVTALAVHQQGPGVQAVALLAWAMTYTVLMGFVTILERRRTGR